MNRLYHGREALMNVLVRESYHGIPMVVEPFCTGLVVLGLQDMGVAVDFNNQRALVAEEVDDEAVDGMLAAELVAF